MCEKDIIGGFQKTSQYILYHKHIIPPNIKERKSRQVLSKTNDAEHKNMSAKVYNLNIKCMVTKTLRVVVT